MKEMNVKGNYMKDYQRAKQTETNGHDSQLM